MIKLLWTIILAYGYSSRSFCVELEGSLHQIPSEVKGQEESEVKIKNMTVITPGADDNMEYDLIEAFTEFTKKPPIQKYESMNQQEDSQSKNDIIVQFQTSLNKGKKYIEGGSLTDEQKAMAKTNKIGHTEPKKKYIFIEESLTPSEKKTSYPVDIKINLGILNDNAKYDICRYLFKPFKQGSFNNNKLGKYDKEFTPKCCFVMYEDKPLTSNNQPSNNSTPSGPNAYIGYTDSKRNKKWKQKFMDSSTMRLEFRNMNTKAPYHYAFVPILYKQEKRERIRLIL